MPKTNSEAGYGAKLISRLGRVVLFVIALGTIVTVRSLPMHSYLRAELTYEGDNGATYPYLTGADSYSWVRKARNYVSTGTACDVRLENGECRDTARNAPFGSEMPYASSLHINAIAWLHRLLALFDPHRPIAASAFWVQVVIGALGVVPSWGIGHRLGGTAGGFASAILVGVSPFFLGRSMGADNDVWNVVLPLFATWLLIESLRGPLLWRGVLCGVGAAATLLVHAAIWSGWQFGLVVLLVGGCAALLWSWIESVAAQRLTVAARRRLLWLAAVVIAIAVASSRYVPPPSPSTPVELQATVFPSGLRWITELQTAGPSAIGRALGSPAALVLSVLGILLLALPSSAPWRVDLIASIALAGAVAAIMRPGRANSRLLVIELAALLAAALTLRLWRGETRRDHSIAATIVVAAWLYAALLMSLRGERFLLLLVAPAGLALGGGLGRLAERLDGWIRQPYAMIISCVTVVAAIALPLQHGYAIARDNIPTLNDAWWDNLSQLKARAADDAIVYTWWHYGYWAEFVTERAVAMDGASVLSRVPHWFARALLAANERESVGLFRMLSCGSDLTPHPEGHLGAAERLMAAGLSPAAAHTAIVSIASLDRDHAAQHLDGLGLDATTRDQVLDATHCHPRPAYLVLSNRMSRNLDFRYQGRWDPRRAEIVSNLRDRPEEEALRTMTDTLGYDLGEARLLWQQARRVQSQRDFDQFVWPGEPFTLSWVPCSRGMDTGVTCRLPPRLPIQGISVTAFEFPKEAPELGELRLRRGTQMTMSRPDTTLVIGNGKLRAAKGDGNSGYGVVVDTDSNRIVVAEPALLRSVFARLLLLDGQFLEHFHKLFDETAMGERVTTWQIDWGD